MAGLSFTVEEKNKFPWHTSGKSPEYPLRVSHDFGEHLPKGIKGTILDAECSYGRTTDELAFRHYFSCARVMGMDIVEERLPKNRYPNALVEFMVGNFYSLEEHFPPRTLDAIFLMNRLTYTAPELEPRSMQAIVRNLHRVLKKDGYLCISHDDVCAVFCKSGKGFAPEFVSEIFLSFSHFRNSKEQILREECKEKAPLQLKQNIQLVGGGTLIHRLVCDT